MKHYSLVKQTQEENTPLVEWVRATEGHSARATKFYAIESHKYKLTSAIKLTVIASSLLQMAASKGLLGEIKDSLIVNKRRVKITELSPAQMLARFATVQRALGSLLHEQLLDSPDVLVRFVEQNLYLAVNDVQAVMSFLVRLTVRLPISTPDSDLLMKLCKAELLDDVSRSVEVLKEQAA